MTDTQLPNLWIYKTPKPYKGPIRDEHGNALNGFKVQDTKKDRKVSILCNGRYMRHYKFPKDLVAPKHPMIRWLNTPMCGISLEDENGNGMSFGDVVSNSVFEGLKPCFHTGFFNENQIKLPPLREHAKKLGFETVETKYVDPQYTIHSLMVGVNKSLKELFDLDAIAQFYHNGMQTSEFSEQYDKEYFMGYFLEQEMLGKLQDLTPVQALLTYDWSNPKTIGELMLTGLCLGYSFESTLALMLE